MIALSLPVPFTKYILCEKEPDLLEALKTRANRYFPNRNVEYVLGDSNANIEEIKSRIPKASKSKKVLTFCFVDPYGLELDFNTIKSLSNNYIDFLILLALHMDAKRNMDLYLKENNDKIASFLADSNWREKFGQPAKYDEFVTFLSRQYDSNMSLLGYKDAKMQLVKYQHLKLYYLAFYSRHNLAYDFWEKIKPYSEEQLYFNF